MHLLGHGTPSQAFMFGMAQSRQLAAYLILSFFLLFPQSTIQKLGYPGRRPACYEDNVSKLVLKGQD
jgi:hypothetical protein